MWDLGSPIRDQTCIPCIARQILKHWTSREVPPLRIKKQNKTLGWSKHDKTAFVWTIHNCLWEISRQLWIVPQFTYEDSMMLFINVIPGEASVGGERMHSGIKECAELSGICLTGAFACPIACLFPRVGKLRSWLIDEHVRRSWFIDEQVRRQKDWRRLHGRCHGRWGPVSGGT